MKTLATFAMGCFWQPQYLFSNIKGVLKTRVGYMGGNEKLFPNPSYEQIINKDTNYAEVIHLEFNPRIISYSQLLDIFWTHHDPTQYNRQGPDVGTQYRSAIFYHTLSQKTQALKSKAKYSKLLIDNTRKIVTQITKASKFYSAEDYHQDFIEKTGRSCHIPRNVFKT